MLMCKMSILLMLVAVCLVLMTQACATEYQIVLNEQLNHHWLHEFVTYPFAANEGTCTANTMRVTGPNGAQPVQLSQIEYWPGTQFVKSGILAFVVDDLAPLATQTYTVSYAPKDAAEATTTSDLVIKKGTESLEAITSRYGVRLLQGEKTYDPPAQAATVPGPILGMRLADGTWFGGSRLYGDTPVAGYTARVLDAGPVFVKVECQYRYTDGTTNTITMQLNAQGERVYYTTQVSKVLDKDGWDILINGLPPLAFQYLPQQGTKQSGTHLVNWWKEREISEYAPGLISRITPWATWVDEFTQHTHYLAFLDTRIAAKMPVPAKVDSKNDNFPDGRELVIHRLDAGAWVTPGSGENNANKSLSLMKAVDGSLYLRISNMSGSRVWTFGEHASWQEKLPHVMSPTMVMQDGLEDLNVIKEMVLDWPETGQKNPHLFLNAEEIDAAGKRNPAAYNNLRDVKQLREDLGMYGYFDTMRKAADVICRYDAIINSNLITPADRKLFRAQMAYLAYRLASPANWSTERGFNSGNWNMTVAHTLNQGLAAATICDHPMAKTWSEKPIAYMDSCMNTLDAAGNWPESSGYARVTESKLIFYAVAASRAGLYDYLNDARFKRMVMYYERTMTPPDPQRVMGNSLPNEPHHPRVTGPYGRGGNANAVGLGGIVAKATAKLDPAYSRQLQWSYLGSYCSTMLGEPMAGYDELLTDPTLPAEVPDWHSELLPSVGVLFRSGVGTPDENYLLLVTKNPTNPDGQIWPSEVGALETWFAKGKPLTRTFPAYPYENYHGLLQNRVMLASNWEPGKYAAAGYINKETLQGFATLSRVDYISESYEWKSPWTGFSTPPNVTPAFPKVEKEGVLPPADQPPVTWQRQAMYVRDDTSGGTNYLVLRDTVRGNQPTQWQFWTLSQGIATPGTNTLPSPDIQKVQPKDPVVLNGNRFTAIGQFGVDLEYYIASPTNTPRHTIRYNTTWPVSGVVRGFELQQDLMHLQLPADGAYFVALFPRDHTGVAPTFTTLGNGTVIKVTGTFGTDYNFLTQAPGMATAEGAKFSGTAATVQFRNNYLVLALAAAGNVQYRTFGLTSPSPANLRVNKQTMSIQLLPDHAASQLTIIAPDGWTLKPAQKGVTCKKVKKTLYQLTVSAGITEVLLLHKGK